MRLAPPRRVDEMLADRRPDRTGEIIAGAQMPSAMPRLRVNQCETSAISGPNVAELPSMPDQQPLHGSELPEAW